MEDYEYELELDVGTAKLRIRARTQEVLFERLAALDLEKLRKLNVKAEPRAIPQGVTAESLSLPEFIDKCTLATHLDRALACCYYISVVQGEKLINKNDVVVTIQQAMLARLTNPNQALNDLVAKAYLARATEKKAGLMSYYLTRTGKDYVEQKLFKIPG